MKKFKQKIIGGVVFLIPIAVIVFIFSKLLTLSIQLGKPVAGLLPIDDVLGIAMVNVVGAVLLVLIVYCSGIVALSYTGKKLYHFLDDKLIEFFPRYAFIKSAAEGMGGYEQMTLSPVMVSFDDSRQICFEVERDEQWVTIFAPGSPDPWGGSVLHVEVGRVEKLPASQYSAILKGLRNAGVGMSRIK